MNKCQKKNQEKTFTQICFMPHAKFNVEMNKKHASTKLFSVFPFRFVSFSDETVLGPDVSFHVSLSNTCSQKLAPPTVDEDRGRVAFAASDDVFGHARVVARVCEACFFDDEIVVGRDEIIGVARWVDQILVPLPLHLERNFNGQNSL